jgi:hypothetical protein
MSNSAKLQTTKITHAYNKEHASGSQKQTAGWSATAATKHHPVSAARRHLYRCVWWLPAVVAVSCSGYQQIAEEMKRAGANFRRLVPIAINHRVINDDNQCSAVASVTVFFWMIMKQRGWTRQLADRNKSRSFPPCTNQTVAQTSGG